MRAIYEAKRNAILPAAEGVRELDPVQQAHLKASNPGNNHFFGRVVAASGDTVVIGAPDEGGGSAGVNGNQADQSAFGAGAAYVFTRNGSTWSLQAYLKASNAEAFERFGSSVAISADTIVVGSPGENSNATGVNGRQDDSSAKNSGAAYVFTRTGTNWTQQAYLKASNSEAGDNFGFSVGVSGDSVVVGAIREDNLDNRVNGSQWENPDWDVGAAYVFTRSGTNWTQQAYLKASPADERDRFGWSVAISGDTVVVGAEGEDSNTSGVNGAPSRKDLFNSGAAYVFLRSGSQWIQQAYLKASNPGINHAFGNSVAISGDTIVVGAPYESGDATGVNGIPGDYSLGHSGAAYVFTRSRATWVQQAYLKATHPQESAYFGWSVAVSGDLVAVGGNSRQQVVHRFRRTATTWDQQKALTPGAPVANSAFGDSVAADADLVVAGAHNEQGTREVEGVPGGQIVYGAGAVYVFVTGLEPEPLAITPRSVAALPSGSIRYDFAGQPGKVHTVTSSTNALAPPNQWTILGRAEEIPAGSGEYRFFDDAAAGHPWRFYRVRSP